MMSIEEQIESLPSILLSFESKINNLELSKIDITKMQSRLDQLDEKITTRKYHVSNVHISNMLELQALLNYASGKLNEAKGNVREAINTSDLNALVTKLAKSMAEGQDTKPESHGKINKSELPEYFTVSTARLILLGIPTLGFYNIYWAYKNWKAIEKFPTTNKKGKPIPVHPALSAFFFPLTSYEMFSRVRNSMQGIEPERKVRAGLYAWVLFFLNIVSLSSIPIIFMQKHMNYIKVHAYGNKRVRKGTSWGEVVMTVLGMLYMGAIISSYSSGGSASLTADQLSKKEKMDNLTSQYNTCSSELLARKSSVDTSSSYSVNSYNSDYDSCEQVRLDQNAAVTEYNQSIGL